MTEKNKNAPIQIQYDGAVSNRELGQLKPTSQHQVLSHINASTYSNSKRQAIEQQMAGITKQAQTHARGQQQASRSANLGQVAMRQSERQAPMQPSHNERALQASRQQAQQRQSVFERLGPQRGNEQGQQQERSKQHGREQGR